MIKRLVLSALLAGIATSDALAWGWFPHPVPEIDGAGAFAAIAVVMGLGVIISRRMK